ncbi:Pilin (type 1 fimbria component protein) [Kosakonia arachidis]|uniref:Pilin (Type 1 fimbria component protein) n=1 Tax=Kosakonia arachidis TaxID=551989 RepID=A0A1I6XIA4_9ENTR|nr:fimbrial protein [Kosakonia arachidis]SFT37833.1 Pilin (type 1 fimbria component protein) [Kosakonia arachidis]
MPIFKSALCVCFCSALLTVAHTVPAQAGDTATITVSGTVVNRTCTEGWTSADTHIELGTVDASTMKSKHDIGASKDFTLTLTNCSSDVKTVKVTATGTADPALSEAFKNTGTATGVDVSIWSGPGLSEFGTELIPNNQSTAIAFKPANGVVDMSFRVKLGQDSDATVTAGTVSALITLNMNYE